MVWSGEGALNWRCFPIHLYPTGRESEGPETLMTIKEPILLLVLGSLLWVATSSAQALVGELAHLLCGQIFEVVRRQSYVVHARAPRVPLRHRRHLRIGAVLRAIPVNGEVVRASVLRGENARRGAVVSEWSALRQLMASQPQQNTQPCVSEHPAERVRTPADPNISRRWGSSATPVR